MIKEFREFILRGNVLDLAVGIIIGAAFGNIVNSLVKDIIMPPIGLILGNVDFTNLYLLLKDGTPVGPYASLADAQTAGAVTINYGLFITLIINFLIVALAVFVLIKAVNRMMAMRRIQEAPPAPEPPKPDPQEKLVATLDRLATVLEKQNK